MKALWIRVDASLAYRNVIDRAEEALGVSTHEAMGLFVQLWGNVARHAKRGDLSGASDRLIESWAGWKKAKKKGWFAAFVRAHHLDADGRIRDWDEYNGHLDDRREREDSPDRKSTYVYYAVDGDQCKIGWSGNPWSRIHEMRTARPSIRLVAFERGKADLERERQRQFEGARIEREWFRLTDELAAHIQSLATAATDDRSDDRSTPRSTPRSGDRSNDRSTTDATTVARAHTHAGAPGGARAIANGTERNGTERTPVLGQESSKKRSGDIARANGAHPDSSDRTAPPAGAPAPELPAPVLAFAARFYPPSSDQKRRKDVHRQLLALAAGEAVAYKGQRLRAGSLARLVVKCGEVAEADVRDPNAAMAVLLLKLGDTSDDSAPGVAQAAAAAADEQRDEAATADELARAEAWLGDRPDVARAIELQLDADGFAVSPATEGDELAHMARLIARRSRVLEAFRRDLLADVDERLGQRGGRS